MSALPAWVFTFIAVSITVVWVVLNVLDPLLSDYKVDPQLHIVMGALVGAAWGARVVSSKDEK